MVYGIKVNKQSILMVSIWELDGPVFSMVKS